MVQEVTTGDPPPESGKTGIVGFSHQGGGVRELVAVDTQGKFCTYPLPSRLARAFPCLFGHRGTLYHLIDHKLYAFSGVTGTWDVLDVPQLEEPTRDETGNWKVPAYDTGFHPDVTEGIEVEFNDHRQLFTPASGKWERLPLKPKEDLSGGSFRGSGSEIRIMNDPPASDSERRWILSDSKLIPIVTPPGSTPREGFLDELIPSVDATPSEETQRYPIDPQIKDLVGYWTARTWAAPPIVSKHQNSKLLQIIFDRQLNLDENQQRGPDQIMSQVQVIKPWQELDHKLPSRIISLDPKQKRIRMVIDKATLEGSYNIDDNEMTLTWEKGNDASEFAPDFPATWKLHRGVPIASLDEPGHYIYAQPIRNPSPTFFDFYQVIDESTFYTFSKVDQAWAHHRFPETLTSVSPQICADTSGGYTAQFYGFEQEGDAIESLVAIDTQGKFHECPLEKPVSGIIPCMHGGTSPVMFCLANERLYAFSGRTGTWDSIAAPNLPEITIGPDRKRTLPTKENGFDTETIDGIVVQDGQRHYMSSPLRTANGRRSTSILPVPRKLRQPTRGSWPRSGNNWPPKHESNS